MRLNIHKRGTLIRLIKSGYSINSISRSLNLSKSTIYYYYKKLKGKKYKEPKFKIRFSETEGEIVGIFAGDGSQYYYRPNGQYQTSIHFGEDMEYVKYVKNMYESYFKKHWPILIEYPKLKDRQIKYRLRVTDKKVFSHFSNYIYYISQHKHDTVKLKNLHFGKNFKIGFVRGLIDTDGSITKSYDKIHIVFYTTSKQLSKQFCNIVAEFNVKSKVYTRLPNGRNKKVLYAIRLDKSDTDKFLKVIKPFKIRRLGA